MGTETMRIELERIDPNPWQTRQENAEAIEQLAASIRAGGLMQPPVGRLAEGKAPHRVQLQFGHRRLAAYRLLHQQGVPGFDAMPIRLQALTDREMAEGAIRENLDRQDLSPIEEAQALRRYRQDFGVSTAEAAAVFGLKASTARKKMQLLDLPKPIQEQLDRGDLPERVGRRLLTVAQADPKEATRIAKDLGKARDLNPDAVEERIGEAMRKSSRVLAERYQGTVEGKWWVLDHSFRKPAAIPPALARDAVRPFVKDADETTKRLLAMLSDGVTAEEATTLYEQDAEAVERVYHLAAPPKCSACPYHSIMQGVHYCNLTPCLTLKKGLYRDAEAARVKAKPDLAWLAWYDRKSDGKGTPIDQLPGGWSEAQQTAKALWTKKSETLRLRLRSSPLYSENPKTESRFVDIVVVGDLPQVTRASAETRGYRGMAAPTPAEHEKRWAETERIHAQGQRLYAAAAPFFALCFDEIKTADTLHLVRMLILTWDSTYQEHSSAEPEAHAYLVGEPGDPLLDRVMATRLELGERLLDTTIDPETASRGDAHAVGAIEAAAQALGVALPPGWADAALVEPPAEEGEDDEDEDPST